MKPTIPSMKLAKTIMTLNMNTYSEEYIAVEMFL